MPPVFDNLDTILVEAIEIASVADRAAFVAQACRGDSVLQRHVEEMIANHFQAGDFLQCPASVDAPTYVTALPDENVGTMIGPYKLRELLGEGGMGIVYIAEQEQPFRRKVALKLIKPGMDSRDVIARFEAERQALALMDHPHIAKVLDAGTIGAPLPPLSREASSLPPISKGGAGGSHRLVITLPRHSTQTRTATGPRVRLESLTYRQAALTSSWNWSVESQSPTIATNAA